MLEKGLNGKQAESLLEGIAVEAEAEAEKLIAEARLQSGEIIEAAGGKAETILAEAGKTGAEKAASIKSRGIQALDVALRKIRMKTEENIFAEVMAKLKSELKKLPEQDDYPEILKGLIVEGGIGLARDSFVNASVRDIDLITPGLLSEATDEIKEISGLDIKIILSKDPPLNHEGIVLTSSDGRQLYNNQFKTRLDRNSQTIRRMIYGQIHDKSRKKVIMK